MSKKIILNPNKNHYAFKFLLSIIGLLIMIISLASVVIITNNKIYALGVAVTCSLCIILNWAWLFRRNFLMEKYILKMFKNVLSVALLFLFYISYTYFKAGKFIQFGYLIFVILFFTACYFVDKKYPPQKIKGFHLPWPQI